MATDAFLKIESTTGVFLNGESLALSHVNENDVLAWSWGDQATPNIYTGIPGKPTVQPLNVTLYMTSASSALLKALNSGTALKSIKLTVRKASANTPFEFFYFEGTGIYVTGYSVSGAAGLDRLTEQWTFQLSTVKYTYRNQKNDGSLNGTFITTYDVKNNIVG